MKHLFVPYELALKLKEKGFDEQCLACYNLDRYFFIRHIGNCLGADDYTNNTNIPDDYGIFSAPLYQQVIDWFREKHKILVFADTNTHDWSCHSPTLHQKGKGHIRVTGTIEFDDYYEALNKAIEEAIKLI